MISPAVQENRDRVVKYLRENPQNFNKIDLFPRNGHGRCLIGMVSEALDHPFVEGDDEVYNFAQAAVGTNMDRLWSINDNHPDWDWNKTAEVLEKTWKDKEFVY